MLKEIQKGVKIQNIKNLNLKLSSVFDMLAGKPDYIVVTVYGEK